jgi:hypothetical protein
MSPMRRSMMVSAGARESMHESSTAAGYWPFAGLPLLGEIVMVLALPGAEALVPRLHRLHDVLGLHRVADRLGQHDRIGPEREPEAAERREGAGARSQKSLGDCAPRNRKPSPSSSPPGFRSSGRLAPQAAEGDLSDAEQTLVGAHATQHLRSAHVPSREQSHGTSMSAFADDAQPRMSGVWQR